MIDTAPVGSTGGSIPVTSGTEQLCGGTTKYIEGKIVTGLSAPEGPVDAVVTGTGVTSKSQVSASDPATVNPPPVVEIKKYVGPDGKCTADDIMNNITLDDTYTLPSTASLWQYCYVITVPPSSSNECLLAVTLVDPAPGGGAGSPIVVTEGSDELCPGDVKYISGSTVEGLTATEGPINATVTGTGVKSGVKVSDDDDATVSPPLIPVTPVVEIKKYAGPEGACTSGDITNKIMNDDIYTLPQPSTSWQYCYVITVPSDATECLSGVTMVDAAANGLNSYPVTSGSDQLCKGAVKYIPGPIVPGLNTTEGPADATVTGKGVISGEEVSDSDGAIVSPPPNPVVEIKKYAGPDGACSAEDIMNNVTLDDMYTLPSTTTTWQYCYMITVPPTSSECLLAVTMVDPAPGAGGGSPVVVTEGSDQLCPSDVRYIAGPLVTRLDATEGPFNVTVTGTGVNSKIKVFDVDDATVSPPSSSDVVPVVEIKKYAGPAGQCSAADVMKGTMKDDTYTLPSGESWQYCYKITVPPTAKECLLAVKMSDPAPIGGGAIDVTLPAEKLCPGDVKYVSGKTVPSGVLTSPEGPINATVTGTGVTSGKEASAKDSASVNPPEASPSDVIPVIEIKKYAGPDGECSAAAIMNSIIKDDTYTLPSNDMTWQYCYKITVPPTAKECILAVKMSDPAPLGGTSIDGPIDVTLPAEQLCPGDVRYMGGRSVPTGVLTSPEGPIDAIVTGTGVNSGKEASAKDSATVKPPQPPGEICPNADPKPPACPEDVLLMSEAATEFNVNPIRIVSQDTETVTFIISNPFDSDVRAMYYQYATAGSGTSRCDAVSPFTYCHDPITVTAHCMTGASHALAVVDVWFVDPEVVDATDKDMVPKCCQPDAGDAEAPTVVYSFKVYCASKCVQAPIRALGESAGESDKKAELCSLGQFGCGTDGRSVNVCHYSAKDGYQTYCVPQADSDVVAYFPKDFCGPCVGGYANVDSTNS